MNDYKDKVAVVTGGAQGIGRCIVHEFLQAGAKEMLASSSLSVADVCYCLGFENPTHFSRIFKQRFGFAPSRAAAN